MHRKLGLNLLLLGAGISFAQSIAPDEVTGHLEALINWYRHVNSVTLSSYPGSDVLLQQSARESAVRALQLGFTFARAEAALLAAAQNPNAAPNARSMDQIIARSQQRVTNIQNRIADVDAELPKARRADILTLRAQRDELAAELELAKEVLKAVNSMAAAVGSSPASNAKFGLLAQIDDLEQTVPEARQNQHIAPAAPKQAASTPLHPESEGLFSLLGSVLSLNGARNQVGTLLNETRDLDAGLNRLKAPVVSQLRADLARSDQLVKDLDNETVQQLSAGQKEISSLQVRFRQLSTAVVPLGEEQAMVESVRGNFTEWHTELDRQYNSALRYLLLRAGGIAVAIFFILAISGLVNRLTWKYVQDQRRRRHLLVFRRIVVSVAISIVLLLGFVTEFGSVATYAGFLTAGIAVALQNVLLSVVAYFFLIGRYGLRVGDRVTIGGVNGQVIELGLVRIYLMELAGTGSDTHSTGRVVVFSNAILFQPSAIYKQMPGMDYAWHAVQLTLTPNSDARVAKTRLTEAVGKVFENYRQEIEQQHRQFERSVDTPLRAPQPETRVRFTDAGLECTVTFPVEPTNAADTDASVVQALSQAIASEPKLEFAPQGGPQIQRL